MKYVLHNGFLYQKVADTEAPPKLLRYKNATYVLVESALPKRKWKYSDFTDTFKLPPQLQVQWDVNSKDLLSSIDTSMSDTGNPQHKEPALLMWHPISGQLLMASLGGFGGTHAHLAHQYGSHDYDEYVRAMVYPDVPGKRLVEIYPWFPQASWGMYDSDFATLCFDGQFAFKSLLERRGVQDKEISLGRCKG